MNIDHVLAVVPVSDLSVARSWYQQLFGTPPTNNPMPSLVEWQATGSGWVQVSTDAGHPGTASVNLAVADLDAAVAELSGRGLAPGAIRDVTKGVRLSSLTDPDGNTVTLIGSFRVDY
ncbi:glyoxalase [Mycobacterium sp. MS1601]|uniref:VOC family protein n=1 Tax=Mycobacterium sp. MS1601 TaxID=1936029 RepID=UPI0009791613|nr:VOC family protein [Mycobacterium sp. MS1601]AQA03756.1 glyoxalase [Mycobacterium sp. MS1601]